MVSRYAQLFSHRSVATATSWDIPRSIVLRETRYKERTEHLLLRETRYKERTEHLLVFLLIFLLLLLLFPLEDLLP
jgi:hypothetical protein